MSKRKFYLFVFFLIIWRSSIFDRALIFEFWQPSCARRRSFVLTFLKEMSFLAVGVLLALSKNKKGKEKGDEQSHQNEPIFL